MKTPITILAICVLATSGLAFAFHKPGHGKGFPGEPSGKFMVLPILAGVTCTNLIEEPEGVDIAVHGGPKKWGFIGEEDIEIVAVSENPDVVQVCFADGLPRGSDISVRISFEDEVVPE